MQASAFSLFFATALAAPSLHNQHRHLHEERQVHNDIAYKTVIQTDVVTKIITNGPPGYGGAPQQQTSSAAPPPPPPESSAPVVAAPPSSSAPVAPPAPPSSSAAAPPSPPASSVAAPSPASSAAAASSSASAPAGGSGSYPFKDIVIFGDNLSDRGNGSSDHNAAGNPETIYGFKTWTDGPIAAEQLANTLKLPIKYDFAYGHADGGSKFGATVDNTFTQSDANAPAVCDQIKNYTTSGFYDKQTVGSTLHFVWGGNNDVIPWENKPKFHPFPEWGVSNSQNQQFCTDLANLLSAQAKSLTDAGAEHVFVPNVYPRHIAPVVQRYFSNDTNWVNTYGQIISQVNTNLKNNLATLAQQSGKKVTYYDAYGFLMNTYNAAVQSGANGINMMKPGDNICDGSFTDPVPGVSSLVYCNQGHGDQYYWMQYLDMTAHVDNLLAQDMQKAIQTAYSS